jgi:hypothetical protein
MTARQKPSLADLLGKQNEGNWTTQEATVPAPFDTPFFDEVIASAQGGESFKALLAKITGPVDPATLPEFPTAECLTAEQVSGMAEIGQDGWAHYLTCPWCKNMMAAAQPTSEEFQEKTI